MMVRTARAGTHWRKKELEMLAQYWSKGLPIDEIAELMGRSLISIECAVSRRLTVAQKAKRPPPPKIRRIWTNEKIEMLRQYWLSDYTDADISKALNMTVHSIHQAVAKYLGKDAKRRPHFFKSQQQPVKKIKTSLYQWKGPIADEQEAWLNMIKAKTPDEKLAATLKWQAVNATEHELIIRKKNA